MQKKFELPAFEGPFKSQPFTYGPHWNAKQQSINNAKAFLTAIFLHRAGFERDAEVVPTDTFSYDRMTDKNAAALLHGIPKQAWTDFHQGRESQVEKTLDAEAFVRLNAYELYLNLKTSPIVGGSMLKPADLSKFESLVVAKLK